MPLAKQVYCHILMKFLDILLILNDFFLTEGFKLVTLSYYLKILGEVPRYHDQIRIDPPVG